MFVFLPSLEKISLFARELLLIQLSIQSIKQIVIKTHLIQGLYLQYFTKYLKYLNGFQY